MRLRKERVRPVSRAFGGRKLRAALAIAAMLGLSLTSAAVMAAPANAADSETFQIQNVHIEYCLTSNGVKNSIAEVFSCNGSKNQTWHWGTHWVGDYRKLINGDGQCLSIGDGSKSAGAHAIVWACNSKDAQYWEAVQDYPIQPAFALVNLNSQLIIQVACDCTKEHAKVDQASEDIWGSPNQHWSIQA
jgi:hypothetical protein